MRGVESVGRCRYLHYRPGKRVNMCVVAIIGVASGAGARDPGCADGPDAVIGAGPIACLHHDSAHLSGYHLLRSPLQPSARADEVLPAVVDINRRAANEVQRCLLRNSFPVVVGGDHSCAIGTWSGVHAAAGAKGSLGLLWVDAHMDSHVPATSPSGALAGTPAPGGIGGDELVRALANLHDDPRLLAVEIAEYNPHHDRNNTTLTLLRRLLCAVSMGGEHDESLDRARTALLCFFFRVVACGVGVGCGC